MIKVIRLNGEILYLNLFQIEYMEVDSGDKDKNDER